MDCGEIADNVAVPDGCPHSHCVSFYELPLDTQIQAMFLGKVANCAMQIATVFEQRFYRFVSCILSCNKHIRSYNDWIASCTISYIVG